MMGQKMHKIEKVKFLKSFYWIVAFVSIINQTLSGYYRWTNVILLNGIIALSIELYYQYKSFKTRIPNIEVIILSFYFTGIICFVLQFIFYHFKFIG
jgi:putative effector of murein hydrolase